MFHRDLVVGAAFADHEFSPVPDAKATCLGSSGSGGGSGGGCPSGAWRELTGQTTPWNTLALWNVRKLVLTGFLAVADGVKIPDRSDAGVEEVTCIATLQHLLSPDLAVAKVVRIPGLQWDTKNFEDEERRQWHERKMKSKVCSSHCGISRANEQSSNCHYPHQLHSAGLTAKGTDGTLRGPARARAASRPGFDVTMTSGFGLPFCLACVIRASFCLAHGWACVIRAGQLEIKP